MARKIGQLNSGIHKLEQKLNQKANPLLQQLIQFHLTRTELYWQLEMSKE